LVITRVRMLHFTKQYRHPSNEIDDFDVSLFQIYRGICVPISIQIKKDMI